MLGAAIGDMVGSIYEFNNIKTKDFPFWSDTCYFTDDTVMTFAVAKGLMDAEGLAQNEIRKACIKEMQTFGRKYPDLSYGQRFGEWLYSERPMPYQSWGNGSAMRVAAVGWFFGSLEETLAHAKYTAEVTHNHAEGIKGAQAVAAGIYLLRSGKTKEEVKNYIRGVFSYDFRKTLDEIRPDYVFNMSCQGTVPQAFAAFFESDGFEDCIRNAISLGGDSDTLAAIGGSLAEAYYGIPENHAKEAMLRMDEYLLTVYQRFLDRRK